MSLDDKADLGEFLKVSESTIDRLVQDGLPHLNLSPNSSRKQRGKQALLRFDRDEVVRWLRSRQESRT